MPDHGRYNLLALRRPHHRKWRSVWRIAAGSIIQPLHSCFSSTLLLSIILIHIGLASAATTTTTTTVESCDQICADSFVPYPLADARTDFSYAYFNCTKQDVCGGDTCCRVEQCAHGCTGRSCDAFDVDTSCVQGRLLQSDLLIAQLYAFAQSVTVQPTYDAAGGQLLVQYRGYTTLPPALSDVQHLAQRRTLTRNDTVGQPLWSTWSTIPFVDENSFRKSSIATVKDVFDGAGKIDRGYDYEYRLLVASRDLSVSVGSAAAAVRIPPDPLAGNVRAQFHTSYQLYDGQYLVCWTLYEANLESPGNLLINLKLNRGAADVLEKTLEANCYMFTELASATYTLLLEQNNKPIGSTMFVVEELEQESGDSTLMYTNGNGVWQVNQAAGSYITGPSAVQAIYTAGAGQSAEDVTAIACANSSLILIGTGSGRLIRQDLGEYAKTAIRLSAPVAGQRTAVISIGVDPFNSLAYFARANQIHVCNYVSQKCDLVQTPPYITPKSLSVDAWHGHLYILSVDGVLYQAPLLSVSQASGIGDASASLHLKSTDITVVQLSLPSTEQASALTLSRRWNALVVATSPTQPGATGRVALYDLATAEPARGRLRPLHQGAAVSKPNGAMARVSSLVEGNGLLYYVNRQSCNPPPPSGVVNTNESCMLYEEQHSPMGTSSSSLPSFTLQHYTLATQYDRPLVVAWWGSPALPATIPPVSDLQMFTTSSAARITWSPQPSLAFQARNAWLPYEYAVELTDAGGRLRFSRRTAAHQLAVPELQPARQYTVKVAVCLRAGAAERCSKPVVLSARTLDKQFDEVSFYVLSNLSTTVVDVSGAPVPGAGVLSQLKNWDADKLTVTDAQLWRLFYADKQTVSAFNTVNEWSSTVVHRPSDRLAISARQSMLYVSDEYSVTAYRLTGNRITQRQAKLYDCDATSRVCPQLLAMAVDDRQEHLYYWLRPAATDGLQIWRRDLYGVGQPTVFAQTSSFDVVDIRQMYVVDEKFYFLTTAGRVGVLDAQKGNINARSLGYWPEQAVQHLLLKFVGTSPYTLRITALKLFIHLDTGRTTVSWRVEPASNDTESDDAGTVNQYIYIVSFFSGSTNLLTLRTDKLEYSLTDEQLSQLPPPNRDVTIQIRVQSAWYREQLVTTKTVPEPPPGPPRQPSLFALRRNNGDVMIDAYWLQPNTSSTTATSFYLGCSLVQEGSNRRLPRVTVPASAANGFYRYQYYLPADSDVPSGSTVDCSMRSHSNSSSSSSYPNRLTAVVPKKTALSDAPVSLVWLDDANQEPVVYPAIDGFGPNAVTLNTRSAGSGNKGVGRLLAHSNGSLIVLDAANLIVYSYDMTTQNSQRSPQRLAAGLSTEPLAMAADWNGDSVFILDRADSSAASRQKRDTSADSLGIYRVPLNAFTNGALPVVLLGTLPEQHPPQKDSPIVVDPFSNSLLYNGLDSTLVQVNLSSMAIVQVTDVREDYKCMNDGSHIDARLLTAAFDSSTRSPLIVLANQHQVAAIGAIGGAKTCNLLITLIDLGIDDMTSVQSVALVGDVLYVVLKSGEVHKVKGQKPIEKLTMPAITDIKSPVLAAHSLLQPMADVSCLRLPAQPAQPSVVAYGRTSALVRFARVQTDAACAHILQPPVAHAVYADSGQANRSGLIPVDYSYQPESIVPGLIEGQTYFVAVAQRNVYTTSARQTSSRAVPFVAGQNFPDAPRQAEPLPITPGTIALRWLPPANNGGLSADQLEYVIYDGNIQQEILSLDCDTAACVATVAATSDKDQYKYQILARKRGSATTAASDPRGTAALNFIRTLPTPGALNLGKIDPQQSKSLNLQWQADKNVLTSSAQPIDQTFVLQYAKAPVDDADAWKDVRTFDARSSTNLLAENLMSGTKYVFRYKANYKLTATAKQWLQKTSMQFYSEPLHASTPAGPPETPTEVKIIEKSSSGRTLTWEAPVHNGGADISGYQVYRRKNSDSAWQSVIQLFATKTEYSLKDESEVDDFEFGVAALNKRGASDVQTASIPSASSNVVVVVIILLLLILLIIGGCIAFYAVRRCRDKKNKKKTPTWNHLSGPIALHVPSGNNNRGPGVVHPGKGAMAHHPMPAAAQQSNAIDLIPGEEIRSLPHVPRTCITVSRQLGKGAFGEVYQGLACNLPRIGPKSVPVAIKTLRSGSSNEDRVKFLKEALLMNSFDHQNIVRLLGVCLENEPHWLVLELMEGGDLLSFLRDARPQQDMPSQVSLLDLLKVVLDVFEGCVYLEQHHHVHRDLAARNCLVSSRANAAGRSVKIADFGLARDVYEVDYYRVDGHGLLPIRWMAPESLIDGVFTVKTDVWSFGVVMWEVVTLGQQPYHGRTNWEVLNFVRLGGRLLKPEHCPQIAYDCMTDCWKQEDRPTFTELRSKIQQMAADVQMGSDQPYPPAPIKGSLPRGQPHAGGQSNSAFVPSPGDTLQSPPTSQPPSAEGNIRIFATKGSARFDRDTGAAHSMREGGEGGGGRRKRRRTFSFKSMRKEKQGQQPRPPSKEDLTELERISNRNSGQRTSDETVSSSRPTSAGAESYTTNRASYDAPLFKGTTNARLNQNHGIESREGGSGNPAYSPDDSDSYYCTSNSSRPAISPVSMPDTSFEMRYSRTPTNNNNEHLRRPRRPAPGPPIGAGGVRTPSTDYTDIDLNAADDASSRPTSGFSTFGKGGVGGGSQPLDYSMTIPVSPTGGGEPHDRSSIGLNTSKPTEL